MTYVRAYNNTDAALLGGWFQSRGLEFNPILLPPNGFIYIHNGVPIAALFVYFLYGTPVAQISNFISNPTAGFKIARALKSLFRTAVTFIKEYAKMSNTTILGIQCCLRKDIVDAFKIKGKKNWCVQPHDYQSCSFTLDFE